ncbi:bleomycin resistance protein [Mesorhizobium neociceri]|uniref:Bleomycin resistance protein n=1 Tax=Mesorhizobium neociceri TaxID=1307853 RepID=A0A838B0H8_9HYPH|nr:VOC family protein [Mesorhizobium neociceri]MBA1139389.1 VOC family protein [Mesorhizobium neociceri]
MPTLEHHRKQAKLYLKWHRERYYPVADAIGSLLPRFRHLSDSQILDHSFKLADALELVARKAGFESWQGLKKGLQTMTDSTTSDAQKPFLAMAEPQLFVSDIAATCSFYEQKLGFTTRFTYGEPPFYAQIFRDGARLNLRHVDLLLVDTSLRARDDLLSATIVVEAIKPLFLEYQAAGASFHQTLRTEPWGARTFIVSDPDGNLIAFATSAAG